MFKALGIGLAVAVFVIFVLLTAYFQSPRLALISIGAVPGVIAGIATILYVTNTSLNIESFMGSIMCLGVSVSNSVMLVTFMDEHWKGGSPSAESAILGAGERLRPILMTACAMTVGMVPMALALEKGSEMQAPLGRAVIGGLVMSTFATLLVVPSIFAVVVGRKAYGSPSIYPDDRESKYYDPNVFAHEDHKPEPAERAEPTAHEVVFRHTDDEIMGFLRSMLHEIRAKRHEMVTHHTVDDLLTPLGFKTSTPDEGGRALDRGPQRPESAHDEPPDVESPRGGL
jgi:predicted RND superfamily exporter protein